MKKFPILTKSFIDEIVNEEDVKLFCFRRNRLQDINFNW